MEVEPAGIIGGRYAIEATLGRGGTGTVYRVLDTRAGRRVALKRVASEGPRASRKRTQLEREYHTLTQLAHTHNIEVFDYGLDEQGPYKTKELLEGDD
jgi:serine/threonine protein kinase